MSTTTSAAPVSKRHEFVFLFEVHDGNPNGDPDAGNAPRIDPETGQGLVTDVCLKRKVRNFVQLSRVEGEGDERSPLPGYEIFVKERGILAYEQRRAYREKQLGDPDNSPNKVKAARRFMCETFYDVRAFGAVMSTGKAGDEDDEPATRGKAGDDRTKDRKSRGGAQKLWNCGQVRGPIQVSFARSIEPILNLEHAITRVALTNPGDTKRGAEVGDEEEATSGQIGRKSTIPYALYRAHGFVSPFLAADTGFSQDDLELLWEALVHMFEFDRSAARGLMSPRGLIVFEHDTALGNALSHALLDRVSVRPRSAGTGASRRAARSFSDYQVQVDEEDLPKGVSIRYVIDPRTRE